jgi:hypothetical protein
MHDLDTGIVQIEEHVLARSQGPSVVVEQDYRCCALRCVVGEQGVLDLGVGGYTPGAGLERLAQLLAVAGDAFVK